MHVTNTVILDTNIVNYYLTNSEELTRFSKILEGRKRALSFATVAELTFWKFQLINEQKATKLSKTEVQTMLINLNSFIVESEFIVPNTTISQIAAELAFKYEKDRKQNRTKDLYSNEEIRFRSRWHDFWIAATAIEKKLTLVTNNVTHFDRYKNDGLNYYDPETDTKS